MGDTMREAFEAARRRIDGLPLNTRRRDNGEYGDYGVQRSWELWQAAHEAGRQLGMEQARREPLTDHQIEEGREETFSTNNPFCPCDSKTMRKAVRWAERKHRIGIPTPPAGDSDTP